MVIEVKDPRKIEALKQKFRQTLETSEWKLQVRNETF